MTESPRLPIETTAFWAPLARALSRTLADPQIREAWRRVLKVGKPSVVRGLVYELVAVGRRLCPCRGCRRLAVIAAMALELNCRAREAARRAVLRELEKVGVTK